MNPQQCVLHIMIYIFTIIRSVATFNITLDSQPIQCGDSIIMSNYSINTKYYHLILANARSVSFDSCESDNQLDLLLHEYDQFSNTIEPGYYSETFKPCHLGIPSLIIDTLLPEQYVLEIMPFTGSGSIHVRCAIPDTYSCGDIVTGTLTSLHPNAYRIIKMTKTQVVTFTFDQETSIGDYNAIQWSLYKLNFDIQFGHRRVLVNQYSVSITLEIANYSLRIESKNATDVINKLSETKWTAHLVCSDDFTNPNVSFAIPYIMIQATEDIVWLDAQLECLQKFGTSLATIKSVADRRDANSVTNKTITTTEQNTAQVYIGLFKTAGDNEDWEWSDRTAWYVMRCYNYMTVINEK